VNRRNFLRLGALFVPAALVEPRRVYSFIWATPEPPPGKWIVYAPGGNAWRELAEMIRKANVEAMAAVILPAGLQLELLT